MSKVTIQGDASGTGIFTIASPNSNTDRTLMLPDEAGTVLTSAGSLPAGNLTGSVPTSAMPAGSVLQVVQGYNSGRYSSTGQTKTSLVTGPSITPSSASSKILVVITTMVARAGSNSSAFFEVRRGSSTSLLQSGQICHFSHWNDYSTATQNNTTWEYLDSPNTTSAISYQIFGWSDGGSTSPILGGRGSENEHNCGVNWLLMEIAA